MGKYIILTDSCVDLTQEMADNLGIGVIAMSVLVEDKVYYNYLDGRELKAEDFYQFLREHKKTSTSQVRQIEFEEFFTPYLDQDYDIIYIAFSSALSGTCASAQQAQQALLKKYPQRQITVIDSLCASMGQGLLVTYAAQLQKENKSYDEVVLWVEQNKLNLCHLFTVGDLDHLRRGGRLSATTAFLGTLLLIKPLLHVSLEGKLVQRGKIRGRKRSLDAMVTTMLESIVEPASQTIYISHGDCYDEALYVAEEIRKQINVKEIVINFIGPVIGSHSGLGTLAIFYLGKDRFLPSN